MDRKIDRQTGVCVRHTNRQIGRRADRHTDGRQTDRKAHKQTDSKRTDTHTNTHEKLMFALKTGSLHPVYEGCYFADVRKATKVTSSHANGAKVGEEITVSCPGLADRTFTCKAGNTWDPPELASACFGESSRRHEVIHTNQIKLIKTRHLEWNN
jgi:hypothetical protein